MSFSLIKTASCLLAHAKQPLVCGLGAASARPALLAPHRAFATVRACQTEVRPQMPQSEILGRDLFRSEKVGQVFADKAASRNRFLGFLAIFGLGLATSSLFAQETASSEGGKMQAVAMHKFGDTNVFVQEDVAIREPNRGEVRVRIKAAGFNPVDWKIREGWYGGDPNLIIGIDCSGVIDAVGPGETRFAIGDEVYGMALFKSSNGSYAQSACVPVELVAKKPKNLSFEQAAAIPLASMTAYRATVAPSAFKKGDVVFVAGIGGGVGVFAHQFLKQIGVKEIFTLAKDLESAKFLQEKMGIPRDHILIYNGLSQEQIKDAMLALNGGRLFDATLDLVGGDTKKLCLELTGQSGHFSTILPEANFDFPTWDENSIPRGRNLSIHQVAIAAEINAKDPRALGIYVRHMAEISKMLESGTLRPAPVQVLGPMSVKTVRLAHDMLETARVKGKLVMVVE